MQERAPGSQVVALLVQHSGGGQVHHLQDGKSGPGEDQPQHVLNTADMRKVKNLPRAAFWGEKFPQKCVNRDCLKFMTKGPI